MFEITPAILETEWQEIEKKINLVRPFAESIHIDIIDGKFTNSTTFLDPAPFKKYTSDVLFELHMMVDNPIDYLAPWADVGFKRFLGHIEKMPDQEEFVGKAQAYGEVGLALDGPTPIKDIKVPFIDLDTIFFYTAEKVGHSGGELLPDRLDKIRELSRNSNIHISVDGGINSETITDAFNSGARRFGITNGIFKTENPQAAYKNLHDICNLLL